MTRTVTGLLLAFVLTNASPQAVQIAGTSPTCGEVVGKTDTDRTRLIAFCSKGIASGAVVGAMAMDSILVIKVSKLMAETMMADRLQSEELVKVWMRGWRQQTGRKAVTVTVEWQSAEIAQGTTSLLGSDKVTVRRP